MRAVAAGRAEAERQLEMFYAVAEGKASPDSVAEAPSGEGGERQSPATHEQERPGGPPSPQQQWSGERPDLMQNFADLFRGRS